VNDFTTGGLIGAALALVIVGLVAYLARRRERASQQRTIDALQAQVVDLRQERTEDKEVNRQLRRDLAGRRPTPAVEKGRSAGPALSSSEPQPANPDAALIDRVAALEVELADRRAEVEQYREQVESFDARMADRDDKLRRYREALADLRAALEAENHPALSGE
jgi:uncharacterized coiled-coil protein SlyX